MTVYMYMVDLHVCTYVLTCSGTLCVCTIGVRTVHLMSYSNSFYLLFSCDVSSAEVAGPLQGLQLRERAL